MTSQGDDDDQRFAELLKPIKDLTQNWEVPLAELLSTYIDDLQHLTITLDDGQTSVNFAQAALVLQGTAAVYSKKVEFLWQLVLKTLDMLRSKKEGEVEEGNNEPGQRGRKKHQVDMTREFKLLVAELAKNINMKDEEETLLERKNALNFIYVTPRQLIEKEGSEQKAMKVNLYSGVAQAKWDLLAGKVDFRINSQYVSHTGGLGEDLNVENQYLDLRQDDTIPMPSPPASPGAHDDPADDAPLSPGVGADHTDHNLSNISERAAGHNHSSPLPACMAPLPSPTPLSTTPEPEFDPWAPLDPYEQVCTPKPMKKGKTIRLPPSLSGKRKTTKPLPPVSEFLMDEMSASLYNPAMLPNVAPVFYDLAAQEIVRRREREKELRLERIVERPQVRRDVFGDEDDPDQDDVLDQYEDYVPDQEDDNPDRDFDFDFPDPHIGGDIGSIVAEDILINDDNERDTDSYEDLVARRVAEFVSKSQECMRSSELARKVATWHDMIGPRLEKVERRKAFDVHAYGSKILDSFSEKISKDQAIPFSRVVRGYKGEEVARFFLSTLMLANTENIEISTAAGTDNQMGMDNVMLSLLSTSRHHHQLAEFQAASQSGSDSGIANTPGGSEDGDTPDSGAGPTPHNARQRRSKKETLRSVYESTEDMGDLVRDSEGEFVIPEPPTAKGRGRKNL